MINHLGNMQIYIKKRERRKGEMQFFMHQFVEAAIAEGIKPVREFALPVKGKRTIANLFQRMLGSSNRSNRYLIVTSQGGGIIENSFPYYRSFRIIPMVWDIWPRSQQSFFNSIKELKCPCVLVTVREMVVRVEQELGIPALWVPEGIDETDYSPGKELHKRSVDIYELGRQLHDYHLMVKELQKEDGITYRGHEVDDNGNLLRLAFANAQDLLNHLPEMKIIVSFPKVDTAPFHEHGGLETMTQRYWESMLNRSLIVGRAPQELIDFIGYNPVVEVDWQSPKEQLRYIINNIQEYQGLVNKNYRVAIEKASWKCRIPGIIDFVETQANRKDETTY